MEFILSISVFGWVAIALFALFIVFSLLGKLNQGKLDEDMAKKQAKSASYVPPPSAGGPFV